MQATVFCWYVVALLSCASVLGYMDRLVIGFLIDPIKADLGTSDLQAGMLAWRSRSSTSPWAYRSGARSIWHGSAACRGQVGWK